MKSKYKVVIVDDESIITMGLDEKIDWDKLGCEVVGVGNHGNEGLELIKIHSPDILITDIIMPGKTGLELAEFVHENFTNTKVILLTAYEDFNFAKQAIGYGVSEYILKPIDKDKIVDKVSKIVDKLSLRDNALYEQNKINKIAFESNPILSKSVLFENAIYGIGEGELSEKYLEICDNEYKTGAIAIIQIQQVEKSLTNLAYFSIDRFSFDFLEKCEIKCIQKQLKDSIVIIFDFKGSSPKTFLEETRNVLVRLLDKIEKEKNIVCHCSLTSVYNEVYLMNSYYKKALKLIRNSYFCHCPSVFMENENVNCEKETPKIDVEVLLNKIADGEMEKTHKCYDEIILMLEKSKNVDLAIDILSEIAIGLNRILQKYGEMQMETIDKKFIKLNGNFNFQKTVIFEKVKDICIYIKSKQRITGKMIIQVERFYGDSNFSLRSVADELELNQSYLSRLFKKEKEMNFSQFLTDYRIEQAKKLLLTTSYKNNEIAEQVGFADERYFSKVFKQRCGKTPKEYKIKGTS